LFKKLKAKIPIKILTDMKKCPLHYFLLFLYLNLLMELFVISSLLLYPEPWPSGEQELWDKIVVERPK
jgi:hypothetical protein